MKLSTHPASFILLCLGLGVFRAGPSARGAGSIAVYSGSQVEVPEATFFAFDDHSIPFRRNLHLTMVAPDKYGPSVVKRGPRGAFDELRAEYYGAVIKINDEYRMWYLGYGFEDPAVRTYADVSTHIGYAVSRDGIHWTKPDLGLVNYHGNTHNNMVAFLPENYTRMNPDGNVHVIYDPEDDDPARLYKMMINVPVAGGGDVPHHWTMMPLISPDGLSWHYAVPVAVAKDPGTGSTGFKESISVLPAEHLEGGGFIKLGGIYYENGQNLNMPDGQSTGRVMSTFWSPDFVHWSQEKCLSFVRYGYNPQEHGPNTATTVALNGNGQQVHKGSALWNRGNVVVGIYGRWQGGQGLGDSHIDLGLITSVDAIHFSEPDPNYVFATPGKAGNWDSGGVLQGHGFENINGKTYIWYGSWNLTASGDKFDAAADMLTSHGEIGLLTMRQDGFGYFSIRDPKTAKKYDTFRTGKGSLTTAAFRVNGGRAKVFLNVDALAPGGLTLELLNARGMPVPGYSADDFVLPTENGVRKAAMWKNHSDIPEGGPYRLHAALKYLEGGSPKLYAMYVDAAESGRE